MGEHYLQDEAGDLGPATYGRVTDHRGDTLILFEEESGWGGSRVFLRVASGKIPTLDVEQAKAAIDVLQRFVAARS